MEYILICSDENEGTTDIVCDWLNYLNKPFIRVSSKDKITIRDVKLFNCDFDIEFSVKGLDLKLSELRSFWYRRSQLEFEYNVDFEKKIDTEDISWLMKACLKKEFDVVSNYFVKQINLKAKLNRDIDNDINKLEILFLASKYGLTIPDTLVVNNKKSLSFFEDKELITKAVGDFHGIQNGYSYGIMTNKISLNEIEFDDFHHTLFQNRIDKSFELRIFFFNNTFYSSAIFSQSNKKTEIDFRNYDFENPNRVIPYKLPEKIEQKLRQLLNHIKLDSGSIDMAYTKQGEYVFFEVNPVGQFEQVSFPCNYNLHKLTANFL